MERFRGNGDEMNPATERSLSSHGREIDRDARAFAGSVQDGAQELQHYLQQQLEARPYTTLILAAGGGYVLGGGLATRLTRLTMAFGLRVIVGLGVQQLAAMLRPGNPVRGDGELKHRSGGI